MENANMKTTKATRIITLIFGIIIFGTGLIYLFGWVFITNLMVILSSGAMAINPDLAIVFTLLGTNILQLLASGRSRALGVVGAITGIIPGVAIVLPHQLNLMGIENSVWGLTMSGPMTLVSEESVNGISPLLSIVLMFSIFGNAFTGRLIQQRLGNIFSAITLCVGLVAVIFTTYLSTNITLIPDLSFIAGILLISIASIQLALNPSNDVKNIIFSPAFSGKISRLFLMVTIPTLFFAGLIVARAYQIFGITSNNSLALLTWLIIVACLPISIIISRFAREHEHETHDGSDIFSGGKNGFYDVLEALDAGIIVLDVPTMGIVHRNKKSETILGKVISDEGGGPIFENATKIFTQENRPFPMEELPLTLTVGSGKATHRDDIIIESVNGHRQSLHMSAYPIYNENGLSQVTLLIENTTSKFKKNREQMEFISIVSHQLKSPLTSMRWILESFLEGDCISKLGAERCEAINEALRSNHRMSSLILDMMNSSRLESGILTPHLRPIQVKTILDKTITTAKPAAQAKEIIITSQINVQDDVITDPLLLEQVVENIITNAIKYSHEKSSVEIAAEVTDGKVSIEVTDHGIGIPIAERENLFQKFYRASNAKKTTTEGTGLGLYISKEIMTLIGGDLNFISRHGHGSTFRITLPIKFEG